MQRLFDDIVSHEGDLSISDKCISQPKKREQKGWKEMTSKARASKSFHFAMGSS